MWEFKIFLSFPFAIAFAAEFLDGKSLMEARFDVKRMRGHLINCLENKFLILFNCIRRSH